MHHHVPALPRLTFGNLPILAASAFLLILILAHGDAVSLGQWQADDDDYAASLRDQGIAFALHRLATDTPRPFSEFLIFVYAALVNALHRTLTGTFLAFCWAILLLNCCAPLIMRHRDRGLPRTFLALGLVSLFLLGHPVADMLYWPVGAAAYAPTVAATCFLAIQVLDDAVDTAGGRRMAMTALAVAITSSEVGAFVGLSFVAIILYLRIGKAGKLGPVAWSIVPFILAVYVLAVTALNGRAAGRPTLVSATGHHILASLRIAFSQISLEKTRKSEQILEQTVTITQQPATLLTHAWSFALGRHVLSAGSPYDLRPVMRFFRTHKATVLSAP